MGNESRKPKGSHLTPEKKEMLRNFIGSVPVPIDLNKVREWWKYGDKEDVIDELSNQFDKSESHYLLEKRIDEMLPIEDETIYECYDCEQKLGDLLFDIELKKKCPRNAITGALQVICSECSKAVSENDE